jgi:diguanylate cyclase (GGDEF)-like protein
MGSIGPTDDLHSVEFRARMLRIGLWPTGFAAVFCIGYFRLTPDGPHRLLLPALAVLTIFVTIAMAWVPIERITAGAWREPFFLAWSTSVIGVVAAMVALDGGVTSPTVALFVLPLIYASLAYPTWSLIAVGTITIGAYLALAFALGGEARTTVYVWTFTLATATWICARQGANHADQSRMLNELSRTDSLTGCLNRRGFEERFAIELARCRRDGIHLGLIVLDLDAFKAVNDSQGHAAGDDLLRWVVLSMGDVLRPGDAIGRLGGDEFGILVPDPGTRGLVPVLRDRLIDALSERTGASAGIATHPEDGPDQTALHHAADADLYGCKLVNRAQAAETSGDANVNIRPASIRA